VTASLRDTAVTPKTEQGQLHQSFKEQNFHENHMKFEDFGNLQTLQLSVIY